MKKLLYLFIASACVALTSCNNLTEGRAIKILNNEIPMIYYDLFIVDNDRGLWIGDSTQYNQGGKWAPIEDESDIINTHKITPPTYRNLYANSTLLDADGRSVFVTGVESNGQLNICRGCNYCYSKYHEAGLIDYKILGDGVSKNSNIRISTALTSKGLEYKLIPQDSSAFRNSPFEAIMRVAQFRFIAVKDLTIDELSATAVADYYIEYTPFGETLGYTTNKGDIMSVEVDFVKQYDEKWQLKK